MWALIIGLLWAKPVENPIVLAAQLARDGEMTRAESVLMDIDAKTMLENASLLYITKGLIALHKNDIAQALSDFTLAKEKQSETEEQDTIESLYLYIAQCHVRLQQPEQALKELAFVSQESPALYLLKIEAYSQQENWIAALEVQQFGTMRYPDLLEIRIQEVCIASKLGLLLSVREMLTTVATEDALTEKQILHMASILRSDGHLYEAGLYLDLGRKRFFSQTLWKSAAIVALEQKDWSLAAEILSMLSIHDPSYSLETAQAYAQAGDISNALLYNSFAPSSSDKLTQRLSLLLLQGAYDVIAPLEKELSRMQFELDDTVRYGLAYAHFQRGMYQEAQNALKDISDPKIFRQSVALQKAIYKCLDGGCL